METLQMCDAVCLRVVLLMMLVTLAFLMMAVAMQHRPLAYYAAAAGLGITGVAVLTVFFG